MTSFYVVYLVEYVLWVLVILAALPELKDCQATKLMMPNKMNFEFDLTLVYFMVLAMSVPNFISNYIYLHKKRQQQLYSFYGRGNKP